MKFPPLRQWLLWTLAVILAAGAVMYLGTGMARAWRGGDKDFQLRQAEYESFERQIYPNRRLVFAHKPKAPVHSVYPPYAFPLFGIFFGPGTLEAGRVILELGSLGALAWMGWQGARALGVHGPSGAALGAVLAAAMAGNHAAMALGHFSLMSTGLVMLQIEFLERKRPVPAGLCWALAMIKPQIALAFVLLFFLKKDWRGLLAGIALLAGLSAFALLWTQVTPRDFFQAGPAREPMNFVTQQVYAGGLWIDALGLNPRFASVLALGILAALVGLFSTPWLREHLAPRPAAGLCAMAGFVLFYHRHYDNIMLFPLLLALSALGLRSEGSRGAKIAGVVLGGSLFAPLSMPMLNAGFNWVILLASLLGAGVLAIGSPGARDGLPSAPTQP